MQSPQKERVRSGMQTDVKYKNEMLKTILNNSEAGVYVSDYHTGEVLYANQKTASFISKYLSADDLIGKICWEAINEGHKSRCEFCAYKRLIGKNGELLPPLTWERYFDKYGTWLKITNQAIRWIDGRLAQITTFHDITELKKMQELLAGHIRGEENRKMHQSMKTLLDKLPIAIGITDVKTAEVVYVNQKLLDMLGYPEPSDLLGRNVFALLPKGTEPGAASRRFDEILTRGGVNDFDVEFATAAGRRIETHLTTCIMDYNNRESSVGIITDTAAEREQRRLLIQAARREREANRLKSNFLSNMSHEIRTPMNAIIGLTEVELRKNPARETRSVYKKINSAAKNLLQIINDILDLSKIEANKVELFPAQFDLEEVLDSVLLVSEPRAEGKTVEMILDLSPSLPRFLIGDKIRLWQILRNLIDNAMKFTERGSVVLSVTEDTKRTNGETVFVSFSVSDTGCGMTRAQIEKAFMPYEQLRSVNNTRCLGTGLGLPIAKQLCELMGGAISVESSQGRGTVMKFTLPFTRTAVTEPESAAPCAAAARDNDSEPVPLIKFSPGTCVLVCEDVKINQEIITSMLREFGVETIVVDNGQAGIEILEDGAAVDLVFMDLHMPVLDGYEAAKIIRAGSKYSALPIISLTADAMTETFNECRAIGFNDIVTKPTTFEDLQNILLKWLPEDKRESGNYTDS